MSQHRRQRLWSSLLVAAVLAVTLSAAIGSAQAQSGELLINPGFEPPFNQEGAGDVFIANGWKAWYIVPDGVTYPINCPEGAPATCRPYRIPVFRNSQPQNDRIPPRARSGDSQQWGISYATYIAGVYQRVTGITPGTPLRFSAFTQGFNCSDNRGCFGGVGQYGMSYEPGDMQTRVGIDPTGGTNAFASTVVWSAYANPLDAFYQQAVEATAQADAVTVFVWSSPTFPEQYTDIYVDDASLVAIGQVQAQPTTAATALPTATVDPNATPAPTVTIPPNTGTYTIVSGDTLSAIAGRYNLTLDQLLALNPSLTRESVIQVGQVINIGGTPQPIATALPPTATVPPAPEATAVITTAVATPTPAPVITATAALANSGLCLIAYDDANGSSARDANETVLAGITFAVKDAGGQAVATHTSDGVTPQHCISNLPDGRYTIDITLPADRTATTETRWSVSLLSGTSVNVIFGSQVVVEPTPQPEAPATAAPTVEPQPAGTRSSGPSLGLLVGGAFILIAVAALAFVLSSRRRN